MNIKIYILLVLMFSFSIACKNQQDKEREQTEKAELQQDSRLFIDLPERYNTPDGLAMAPDGSLILSVPNFNNEHLMEKGMIEEPSPPFMARIDENNNIEPWYEFKEEDYHRETGKMGPMDAAYGPDGNLYVADMQIFYDDDHKSRLVRINVENGEPTSMDVVVTGFNASNGVFWEDSVIYVTESVLSAEDDTLISGVYAFTQQELLSNSPVILKPYEKGEGDEHLVLALVSDNHMGFGADGVTFDDEGNLYTTLIEEGKIFKSTVDEDHKATETVLWATDNDMLAPDGMIYDPGRERFYVADFLNNAVHAIDKAGNVTTMQKNGDVTGENGRLDQPAEVILRGDDLIIVNMDMAWATEGLSVNTKVDGEYNLAYIPLDEFDITLME